MRGLVPQYEEVAALRAEVERLTSLQEQFTKTLDAETNEVERLRTSVKFAEDNWAKAGSRAEAAEALVRTLEGALRRIEKLGYDAINDLTKVPETEIAHMITEARAALREEGE